MVGLIRCYSLDLVSRVQESSLSCRIRRIILPVLDLGILATKTTPPRNCLWGETWSATKSNTEGRVIRKNISSIQSSRRTETPGEMQLWWSPRRGMFGKGEHYNRRSKNNKITSYMAANCRWQIWRLAYSDTLRDHVRNYSNGENEGREHHWEVQERKTGGLAT